MQRTSFLAVVATCAMAILPLDAQNCGDSVTTNVILTSNLGPCPANGLIVVSSGLTIDLNGFSILGSGGGTGILVQNGGGTVIKGGGIISGFETGVSMSGPSNSNVEVRDTAFTDVGTGVFMSQSGTTRVIDNVMHGRGGVGAGIVLFESTIKLRGNQISGFAAGISAGPTIGFDMTIVANTITANTEGVVATSLQSAGLVIRANTVSGNALNGIRVLGTGATLDSNYITGNGGDGILVQQIAGPLSIQDNIVTGNGGRGIALETSRTIGGRTIDNESRSNGVDLFWDGTGPNSCWSLNLFNTSQPSALPACL